MIFFYAGERPHACDVCGKKFRVRGDLKRHLKIHNRQNLTAKSKPQTARSQKSSVVPPISKKQDQDIEQSLNTISNSVSEVNSCMKRNWLVQSTVYNFNLFFRMQ